MSEQEALETVEAVADAMMSYLFAAAQPDRGDVFSWLDDRRHDLARAAIAALSIPQGDQVREALEEARDILSGLSSYLGAGLGGDATSLTQFDDRIRWGIDHIGSVYRQRAAAVVEECSKRPSTTWGQVKRAILDDTCLPTAHAPKDTQS